MCPAVGQGALAIETRDDGGMAQLAARSLDDLTTRRAVTEERELLAVLGGGCQVPIGAHATVENFRVHIRAIVASPDGTRVVRGARWGQGPVGRILGEQLLQDGAREILDAVYSA